MWSSGPTTAFWGNFGMLVRAYAYIRTMGPDGLRAVSDKLVVITRDGTRGLKGHAGRAATAVDVVQHHALRQQPGERLVVLHHPQVAEHAEVTTGAAAEVQDPERRGLEVGEEGVDVLADVVIASAFPEIFGMPVVIVQR